MQIYYTNERLLDELVAITAIIPEAILLKYSDDIHADIYLCLDESGLLVYSSYFKPINLLEFYRQFINKRRPILHNENLLQAMNINKLKQLEEINALDLTGGLGRDSILMALAGINVTVVEINPYLAVILNYLKINFIAELGSFDVVFAEASKVLSDLQQHYHYIYYDPMFEDNKHALAKKDMQLIDLFVRKEAQQTSIVPIDIYNKAKIHCHKLIVKRDNKQSFFIPQPKPTYQKLGKTIRFDIYQGDIKI